MNVLDSKLQQVEESAQRDLFGCSVARWAIFVGAELLFLSLRVALLVREVRDRCGEFLKGAWRDKCSRVVQLFVVVGRGFCV